MATCPCSQRRDGPGHDHQKRRTTPSSPASHPDVCEVHSAVTALPDTDDPEGSKTAPHTHRRPQPYKLSSNPNASHRHRHHPDRRNSSCTFAWAPTLFCASAGQAGDRQRIGLRSIGDLPAAASLITGHRALRRFFEPSTPTAAGPSVRRIRSPSVMRGVESLGATRR